MLMKSETFLYFKLYCLLHKAIKTFVTGRYLYYRQLL